MCDNEGPQAVGLVLPTLGIRSTAMPWWGTADRFRGSPGQRMHGHRKAKKSCAANECGNWEGEGKRRLRDGDGKKNRGAGEDKGSGVEET